MPNIGSTIRFGAFPSFRIGRFCIVYFPRGKRKLSFYAPKNVETKNGLCDLWALNVGRLMLLYEVPERREAIQNGSTSTVVGVRRTTASRFSIWCMKVVNIG
jgi:hypothetical protein